MARERGLVYREEEVIAAIHARLANRGYSPPVRRMGEVHTFAFETECLLPVAERRYDRRLFPSTGQYDWFSAQILYCLVRFVKPQSIIEVSTSSGYSTLIQAIALKRNRSGTIFINRIVQRMPRGSYAYLHDLIDQYPQLSPHRYDHHTIKRQDRMGRSMEWNEAIWLVCGEFRKALREL